MKKGILALCFLLLTLAAAPAWAGTVYAFAQNRTSDGNMFVTHYRFYNDSGENQTVQYLFIPEATNGTTMDRETAYSTLKIPPRNTKSYQDLVPVNQRGILEIVMESSVSVTARMVGEAADGTEFFGADLPVVTSDNVVNPGQTATLPGLRRQAGQIKSDFFILNASVDTSSCAVEVLKKGGAKLTETILSIPPLTVFPFFDALGLLGVENTADASIAVTCDQSAYPFSTIHDLDTAQMVHVPPAGGGSSRLDPFPSSDCPDGAAMSLAGVFHVPQRGGGERATYLAPITPGTYSEVELTMEFTFGGWDRNASANHAIFWLNRSQVWRSNVLGYLNAFGPNKNFVKNLTNLNLPAGAVQTAQDGAVLEVGRTYTVNYLYSTASRLIEAVISVKGGQEIVRIQDAPTVNRLDLPGELMLVFGHTTFEHGPEVPTYGWQYANLCLQVR